MQKLMFKMEGMMCPMCESHTNDAVRNIYPKAKVSSSHKSGETVVVGEGIDPTRVKETIEKRRLTPHPPQAVPLPQPGKALHE